MASIIDDLSQFLCRDATIQTLLGERRKLDLNHVEPTRRLWRAVELEALREGESFFGAESFIKGAGRVRVQVVLYDSDLLCLWIASGQLFHKQCVFLFGAPRKDLCLSRFPVRGSIAINKAHEPCFS